MSQKTSFLESIFVKHQKGLRRFIANKLGNPDDAEDIVQDTFHNVLATCTPEELEDPKAYLYQAANNLALNRIRRRQRHEHYVTRQTLEDENETLSPEYNISARKDLEKIQQALHKLPDRSRQVFLLSRVQARTYPEISKELNISVSSVEKHIIRTLKFLREQLETSSHPHN